MLFYCAHNKFNFGMHEFGYKKAKKAIRKTKRTQIRTVLATNEPHFELECILVCPQCCVQV